MAGGDDCANGVKMEGTGCGTTMKETEPCSIETRKKGMNKIKPKNPSFRIRT